MLMTNEMPGSGQDSEGWLGFLERMLVAGGGQRRARSLGTETETMARVPMLDWPRDLFVDAVW